MAKRRKVIQIAFAPETEDTHQALYARGELLAPAIPCKALLV